MSLRSRIIDRGRQLVQSPAVMRWVSDDRVMRAAEGVMDAKSRVRLAWHMLKNGRALPAVDPALDDSLAETISSDSYPETNGHGHSQSSRNGSGSDYVGQSSNGSLHAGAAQVSRNGGRGPMVAATARPRAWSPSR